MKASVKRINNNIYIISDEEVKKGGNFYLLCDEEEAKLRQIFKNRSNCYADADDVVQAMDENCFIETIKELQSEKMNSLKNTSN